MKGFGNLIISGTLITVGTGSCFKESLDVVGYVSASTFCGDGSNLSGISSYTDADATSLINSYGVVSSSAQISYTGITNVPAGIVSGSSQLTASFDTRYVDFTSNQTISGTKTFQDIIVNGTGSFSVIQSITGSAKIIGDAFIVVNNNTPTQRYAGLAVYDSGSATPTTASFFFDGLYNDWNYEYTSSGGVDYAVALFGPEYQSKGIPTYPTLNKLQKGSGSHHLIDSNITDTGTLITMGSNVVVQGSIVSTTTQLFSSSAQVNADTITNFDTNVDARLNTKAVVSGSNLTWNGSVLNLSSSPASICGVTTLYFKPTATYIDTTGNDLIYNVNSGEQHLFRVAGTNRAIVNANGIDGKVTCVNNTNNSSFLQFWTGSQAAYDAIGTKNVNTLYFII